MNQSAAFFFVAGTVLAASANVAPAQTMRELVQPQLERALASGSAFISVSAASGLPAVAPGSMGSLFGPSLAAQTASAPAPYPTSLRGISVQIVDSTGMSQLAQLLYVSPDQINYMVPAGAAPGSATINIMNGTGNVPSGAGQVQPVAPALFTANGNGQGVVAATAYRTVIPTSISSPVPVFQCGAAPGSCVSVPIDPGIDAPVTVTLYATGVKGRSSDAAVTLTIGGMMVPIRSITSGDSSSPLAGIDQVTFGLPLSLRGSGEVNVVLTVDGIASNTARINIR